MLFPDFPPYSASLSVFRGAFVTLYCGGKLRGCVGQVENPGPLAEAVARAAINAALHDPRFPPVGAEEIASLEIEISVLSPLEPIAPEAIIAGQTRVAGSSTSDSEDCCFRRSPRSGDGPASGCWKKPAPKLVCPGMPGGILRLKYLHSLRRFFRRSELRTISRV